MFGGQTADQTLQDLWTFDVEQRKLLKPCLEACRSSRVSSQSTEAALRSGNVMSCPRTYPFLHRGLSTRVQYTKTVCICEVIQLSDFQLNLIVTFVDLEATTSKR